jgi:hypothetical protein
MKSADQRLLEEAYNQVNEGVWDSIKKTGAGLKAGAQAVGRNIANTAVQKLGGQPTKPNVNVGQAVARAQHTSLFNSFVNKAKKEINDFLNDANKLLPKGKTINDYPDIAQKINQVNTLLQTLEKQHSNVSNLQTGQKFNKAGQVIDTKTGRYPSTKPAGQITTPKQPQAFQKQPITTPTQARTTTPTATKIGSSGAKTRYSYANAGLNLFDTYYNSVILSEEEKVEQQGKQALTAALNKPEVQQQIQTGLQQIYTKYNQQIEAAKQQGPEAVQQLLKQLQPEVEKALTQQQNESLLTQEGWFDRARSNVSGAINTLKGGQPGQVGANNLATNAVAKRFQILQNTIGKDLRELQRDMEYTSNVDNTVKDQVNRVVDLLGQGANNAAQITPVQSKFGDMRNKIGHMAMKAIPAATFAAVLGPAVGAVGIAGIPAKMAISGVTGTAMSALGDMINGNDIQWNKAIKTGLVSAATSGAFSLIGQGISNVLGSSSGTTPTISGKPSSGANAWGEYKAGTSGRLQSAINNITGQSGATPAGVPNVNVDKAYDWSKIIRSAIGNTTPGSDMDDLKIGIAKNIAKIAQRTDLGLPKNFKLSDKQIIDIYNQWVANNPGAEKTTASLAKNFNVAEIADFIRQKAGAELPNKPEFPWQK